MRKRAFRFGLGHDDVEREVDDELAFHLAMRTQQLTERGMDPEAARREALRQFGDLAQVRATLVTTDTERERTMRRSTMLEELGQDLRQALRQLRLHRGFALTVVLMLALGIGANTTIFTLVEAVLLRPLPVRDPGALVVLGDPARTSSFSFTDGPMAAMHSYETYQALRRDNTLVSGLLATGITARLDVAIDGSTLEGDRPRGRFVSGNYFEVLGVRAALGRTLDSGADAAIGGAPVVTISHDYWMRRFDGNRGVVGREITINGARFTILGVTPPSFQGEIVGTPTDLWIPVTMRDVLFPNQPVLASTEAHWLLLIGRLKPGTSLAVAQAGFASLVKRQAELRFGAARAAEIQEMQVPVSSGARGISRVRASFGPLLLILMTGVGLLLLIVCANVANLLLARSVARAREMTVRLAIGAGRFRLVRQLLAESLVLALVGSVGGLAMAWYGSRLMLVLLGGNDGRGLPLEVRLDLPVLLFTATMAVLAVLLFGLVPALSGSRVDLASAMRAHARAVTGGGAGRRGRHSLGRLLIAGQVALSLVLLVGASLLVRSLSRLEHGDTGLDRDHLLVADVDRLGRGLRGARADTYLSDVSERLRGIPGVRGVSWSATGIFSGMEMNTAIQVAGFTARTPDDSIASFDHVSAGYVSATGARLLQGREFTVEDVAGQERVAMLNQTMARFYFGDRSPVGEYFRMDDTLAYRIVGVVADLKVTSLEAAPERRFYLPYRNPAQGGPDGLRFQVRTSADPAAIVPQVRAALSAADPSMVVEEVEPLAALMRQSIRSERMVARLASGFGALALLLAAFGLYGVLTYAVSRRTGEIGLRVALGAQRRAVITMVLRDALVLVTLGVAVGAPLALAGGRLLANQLHGIGTMDPVSLAVALGALASTALVAATLPALRASRVTPLTALREE